MVRIWKIFSLLDFLIGLLGVGEGLIDTWLWPAACFTRVYLIIMEFYIASSGIDIDVEL